MSTLLGSRYELLLRDSYSSIPIQEFIDNPDLSKALSTSAQGSFGSTFAKKGCNTLLINGYENFYAAYDQVYPAVVTYVVDKKSGCLKVADKVLLPQGVGSSATGLSPNGKIPFAGVSTYRPIVMPDPANPIPFIPHVFRLELNRYDADGKLTPALSPDMKEFYPDMYDATIAYNGFAGVSTDGKYVVTTYATTTTPGVPGALADQRIGVLRVEKDLSALVPVADIETAPTEVEGLFSFPQNVLIWPQEKKPWIYNMISAENSWNLQLPLGSTAQIVLYTFNSRTAEIVRHDRHWVSQYIQGVDVDRTNNRVTIVMNSIEPDGVSIDQISRAPYDNPALDKEYELRVWDIKGHRLDYLGGLNLNATGIQARSSPNGKLLAVTSAPTGFNAVFPAAGVALSPIAKRVAPNTVTLYEIGPCGELTPQSTAGAAPLAFGAAFTPDSKLLAITGQPTYEEAVVDVRSWIVGQKDTQLYEIEKQKLY